jgi:hypothetical protein
MNSQPSFFLKTTAVFCLSLWSMSFVQAQMTDVLTFHNDSARTGQALNEQILNPSNVNSNQFGQLWELPTDGKVFAEPLYAAGISIPGKGIHNVLFVVTENDSAYAFDADSTNMLWHAQLLGPGEIPYQTDSCTILPQIGITATPVIDRQLGSNGTIFIQAMSQDSSSNYFQRLYALDLATGQDRVPPVEITATYPGTGDDSTNGTVVFVPVHYVDRACLLLVNGVVYTAWSAHCNSRPAGSWVIGFDENTLTQRFAIDLQPNSYYGSIWNSGGGPSTDTNGNIYVTTGNGAYQDWYGPLDSNGFPVNQDYGNAFVKLAVTNNSLVVEDYFAMYNIIDENDDDIDLGAGCAVLLPDLVDAQGNTRHLAAFAGKDQNLYIGDRSNLGKYNPTNNDALYQELPNVFADAAGDPPEKYGETGGIWSVGAYFNNTLYYAPVNGHLMAFPIENALVGATSSEAPTSYGYPGATPSVSANGVSNGIVWTDEILGTVSQNAGASAVLHAYAATNVAVELYNSAQATNNRDQFGLGSKFAPPMVASSRVYVATSNGVAVFGLIDQSVFTPIEQWRNNYFGNPSNVGAGANSASPAGDGVANLIKYALGLNPFSIESPNNLATASIQQVAGHSYLTLTVNRVANPTDVTEVAQVSSDLQTWASGPSYTTTLTNTASQLVVRDNMPVDEGTNGAIRLLILPTSNP